MPDFSRRGVLGSGLGVTVLGLIGLGGFDSASAAPRRQLRRSQYLKSVGRTFTAQHGGRGHELRLNRIDDVQGATGAMREGSFNLIFTARSAMPDGVYAMSRPGVPTHSLFLSRVEQTKHDRFTMQALINRTVS